MATYHSRPTKHDESVLQRRCVEWFHWQHSNLNGLLFSVPNGGKRSAVEAAILKAEGVTAGVSDLILFVPNSKYHALCIEMKTKTGKQSDLQKEWQKKVESVGYRYVICRTYDDFIEAVNSYLLIE